MSLAPPHRQQPAPTGPKSPGSPVQCWDGLQIVIRTFKEDTHVGRSLETRAKNVMRHRQRYGTHKLCNKTAANDFDSTLAAACIRGGKSGLSLWPRSGGTDLKSTTRIRALSKQPGGAFGQQITRDPRRKLIEKGALALPGIPGLHS